MRKICVTGFVLLFLGNMLQAQQVKWEAGITPLQFGPIFQSLNHVTTLQLSHGIYGLKPLGDSPWSIDASAVYGVKPVNDDCKGCADHFSGTGLLKAFNLMAGVRYTLMRKVAFPVKPFTGISLNGHRSVYSGVFSGGFSGQGLVLDGRHFNGLGGSGVAGIQWLPCDKLSVTAMASLALLRVSFTDNNELMLRRPYTVLDPAIALRLGWVFMSDN